ncbi:unnamed protein product [Moneuplotes crassus]|uniref:Uncharacterized protein n=1 Tax=Euplotes crassus TaxID=5936 RepID=A0AAD2D0J6_EUPCR|nr:unnamed protein product [Moneuplotes crassus]
MENKGIDCLICYGEYENKHAGISCSQDNFLCHDCFGNMAQDMFEHSQTKIPAKCFECQEELNKNQVLKLMNPIKVGLYKRYCARTEIDSKSQRVQKLPYCTYYEIWDINNNSHIFYCQGDSLR